MRGIGNKVDVEYKGKKLKIILRNMTWDWGEKGREKKECLVEWTKDVV